MAGTSRRGLFTGWNVLPFSMYRGETSTLYTCIKIDTKPSKLQTAQNLKRQKTVKHYNNYDVIILLITHYQTTNFRLFQTEWACRQQFQIWRKRQKVIQMGRKHCGKRRNCSLRAISPFPRMFSKVLFFQLQKTNKILNTITFSICYISSTLLPNNKILN